jgi:putative radical SAM enzyme (TIGR03279 family)
MKILHVKRKSAAYKAGLRPGDRIVTVNGNKAVDFLDFSFCSGEEIEVLLEKKGERLFFYTNGDLSFPEFSVRRCSNHCLFCFVSQLPPKLRPSLYIKDDDYRLSFLHGAYITLSNMKEEDFKRIERLRLSPLYVSVQAVSPDVRRALMRCPEGFDFEKAFDRLIQAGIRLHTQIVLVPGYNDGPELEKSVDFLLKRAQGLLSVTLVPVGLTAHRKGLTGLRPFTREEARMTLDYLGKKQEEMSKKGLNYLLYATDEFYLIAQKPFPLTYHPELIDNGVGLYASFKEEFDALYPSLKGRGKGKRALLTGVDGARLLQEFPPRLRQKGVEADLIPVENTFFGPQVTVTGLLTGRDILRAAGEAERLYSRILVPDIIFNEEGLTLDGYSKKAILKNGKKIKIVPTSAKGWMSR